MSRIGDYVIAQQEQEDALNEALKNWDFYKIAKLTMKGENNG